MCCIMILGKSILGFMINFILNIKLLIECNIFGKKFWCCNPTVLNAKHLGQQKFCPKDISAKTGQPKI